MKRKFTPITALLLALPMVGVLQPVNAGTGTVSACREIQWQPYQVYSVRSALHERTHIILPEPIQGTPVPGNPQLWDIDGENIHLFVKPKNFGNKEGGHTTVTAISTTNTSYDFRVTRVKSNPDICIRIVQDNTFALNQRQGWKTKVEQDNESLRRQLDAQRAQAAKQKQSFIKKVDDSLHNYKSNIYTRYDWKDSRITDVWDDGRFTYIRLKEAKKGILQVIAEVGGKEEAVTYDFNSNTKLYTVAGLYPKFILRYDNDSLVVARKED